MGMCKHSAQVKVSMPTVVRHPCYRVSYFVHIATLSKWKELPQSSF